MLAFPIPFRLSRIGEVGKNSSAPCLSPGFLNALLHTPPFIARQELSESLPSYSAYLRRALDPPFSSSMEKHDPPPPLTFDIQLHKLAYSSRAQGHGFLPVFYSTP